MRLTFDMLTTNMKISENNLHTHPESSIQDVLEWLAISRSHITHELAEPLFQQIRLVRDAPISTPQRGKLLDLFYCHIRRLIETELPELHQITLPVSRRVRQRIRSMQVILESLVQDYLNTLSELFDPQVEELHTPPEETLKKIFQCIAWNVQISHLAAAPTPIGLWLELHSTMRTARKLGVDKSKQIESLYLTPLLAAIAQPASFCSDELHFIGECITLMAGHASLSEHPPASSEGIFWIDPAADFPAHAMARRASPPDTPVWFFSCSELAHEIRAILQALSKGETALSLNLPDMANTNAGQRILSRLLSLWGSPSKRRFTRRRQSYRASIYLGLETLCSVLNNRTSSENSSEWIVTNESPDGYAVMHVSGQIAPLTAGDILAIQPHKGTEPAQHPWHICLVRWAISENPEHLELGLQLLSSEASSAVVFQQNSGSTAKFNALVIPEAPPLRPLPAVIVETGQISTSAGKLIVVLEKENLKICELLPTQLNEQTSRIEVFSVEPDGTA